ncbi:MAG: SBBP repeat-containing protein [Candidatus Thermoplasmatota archaeon]|nr:SBBP repeat-containing protein [Candidatus Thermoplasmatota archaeon]
MRCVVSISIALIMLLLVMNIPVFGSGDPDTEITQDIPLPIPGDVLSIVSSLASGPFIENRGQWDPSILYMISNEYGKMALAKDGIYHWVHKFERRETDPIEDAPEFEMIDSCLIKALFEGGSPSSVQGEDPVQTSYNFFLGNDSSRWASDVRGYGSVLYEDVWDGIDIHYYQKEGRVKYDLLLSPGADPDLIRMRIEGAGSIRNDGGDLIISTPIGVDLLDSGLVSYYTTGEHIPSSFLLEGNIYGFDIGPYDRTRSIVIDPLVASTYAGGTDRDIAKKVMSDDDGNWIVAGETFSTDLPVTTGVIQSIHSGKRDCAILKFDHRMKNLIFATYYGGSDNEFLNDMSLIGNDIIIGGYSNSYDLPITNGSLYESYNGNWDGFLARIDSKGSNLTFSTYIGGPEFDSVESIKVNNNNMDIYITGRISSNNYPITNNSMYKENLYYGFLSILSSDCSEFIYSTYFSAGSFIELMDNGYVVIAVSNSIRDYPTTPGSYDTTHNGNVDIYIACFDIQNNSYIFATYIGGVENDIVVSMNIDMNNNIYITGTTYSNNFPVTSDAYSRKKDDTFVSVLSSDGKYLLHSTFIGGSDIEVVSSIALDGQGYPFITGYTRSGDYPTTWGSYDRSYNQGIDSFITSFDRNLSYLRYSTYFGGSSNDYALDIYMDELDQAVIAGETYSSDLPTVWGCYDVTWNGHYDMFISVINISTPPSEPLSLSGDISDGCISLEWDPPLSNGGANITGYNIYRGRTADNMSSVARGVQTLSYDDRTIVNGRSYVYHVTAVNAAGESNASDNVTVFDDMVPIFLSDLTPESVNNGDMLFFSVIVSDNVLVTEVSLSFRIDDGDSDKVDMVRDGIFWNHSTTVPNEHIRFVHYRFTAADPSGNSNSTKEKSILIIDSEPPLLHSFNVPSVVKPERTVSLDLATSDNVGVLSAEVEHWYDDVSPVICPLVRKDGMKWGLNLSAPPVQTVWRIVFHSHDGTNRASSDLFNVSVIDSDPPTFLDDLTPSEIECGAYLEFKAVVLDDVSVGSVLVNFSHDGKFWQIREMEHLGSDVYSFSIYVNPSLESILYSLESSDIYGNSDASDVRTVNVIDILPPFFIDDVSDRVATTGDECLLSVRAVDNMGISKLSVFYWYSFSEVFRKDITSSLVDDRYSMNIRIPSDSDRPLNYYFEAVDLSGNVNRTPDRVVPVLDDDPPTIFDLKFNETAGTGESYMITASFRDNIRIDSYSLSASMGGSPLSNRSISGMPGEVLFLVDIPVYEVGNLTLLIDVSDRAGNVNSTGIISIPVLDTIPPRIPLMNSFKIRSGETFEIFVNATDNIGIARIEWQGLPEEFEGDRYRGSISKPGYYGIMVTAYDEAGNTDLVIFTIRVVDEDVNIRLIIIGFSAFIVLSILIYLFFFFKFSKRPDRKNDEAPPSE